MPQFDTSSFVSQLFWFSAVFALLYFAVVRPTLPKVSRVIDARDAQVSGDLDVAEAAKQSADAIRTAYDASIKAAREAAQAEVARARDGAAAAAEARLKALGDRLDADSAAAVARLDAARVAARASLAGAVSELTGEAVTKLIGIDVTADDVAAALAAG